MKDRDVFAAFALVGLIASETEERAFKSTEALAEAAYEIADAMPAARSATRERRRVQGDKEYREHLFAGK